MSQPKVALNKKYLLVSTPDHIDVWDGKDEMFMHKLTSFSSHKSLERAKENQKRKAKGQPKESNMKSTGKPKGSQGIAKGKPKESQMKPKGKAMDIQRKSTGIPKQI